MGFIVLYLIANLFTTYVLFRFISIVLGDSNKNQITTGISYFLYFLATSYAYLVFDMPAVTILANLIFIFIISLNYESSTSLRIFWTISIYSILAVIETLFLNFSEFTDFSMFEKSEVRDTWANIAASVFSYIFVLVYGYYKKPKARSEMPFIYIILLVLFPLATVYLTICLLASNLPQYVIIVGIMLLLVILVITFRIYDELSLLFEEKTEKEILNQHSINMKKQINLMETSNRNVRAVKHDLDNLLLALESLVRKHKYSEALKYIHDIKKAETIYGEYAKSGVTTIDSILNHKISDAEYNGIRVDLTLNIPSNISLNDYDMVVILGNLLDNAVEANRKIDRSNRYMSIVIEYHKNIFSVTIKNRFEKELINADLATVKPDKEKHGMGIKQVEKIIEKYDGSLATEIQEDIFATNVILYIE